ncbi:MAG: translocation/assembly module TamB domain-containing protein [Desulfobacterales bacterium]
MTTEKISTNKLRRIVLWLFITAMVLLAGTYALRSVLIAPYAINFLERTVEANLGLKIIIGELGGSYFSNIKIKNVSTVKRLTDSPLTDLRLRQLKLTYRLWDILWDLPLFLAGLSIDIAGAQVSIDLTKETGIDEDGDASKGVPMPSVLPQIRIQDSSFEVKGNGYETRFDGISFATRSDQPGKSLLQLRVAHWSLNHPDLRYFSAALETDMSYSNENLMVEKLLIDKQLVVKSATIGLGRMPHQIPFEMILNLAGGQFDASGRMAANRLHVAMSGSDIDLSRISELLASQALPFGGRLSLQGRLSLLLSDPRDMIGDLKIQVFNGSFQDTTLDKLFFRFMADGRHLRVEDLQLTDGANRISVSQASVPLEVIYGNDLDSILRSLAVDWRLEGTRIPSLLKIVGVEIPRPDDRIPSHRLVLNGQMKDGRVKIPDGRLDVEGGHILLKAADITLPIGERTFKDSPLVGDLSIDLPQVEVLSRIFALPALGGSLKGQVNVSGTIQAPQGAASISGQTLTYRNKTLGNLSIQATADIKSVAIESAVLERDKDRAIGHGRLILAEKSFENVNIELSVNDLGPYFSELLPLWGLLSDKSVNVQGGLKASVKLAGPFAGPTGSLNLQTRKIHIDGTPLGDADMDLMFSADRISIQSAELAIGQQRLQLEGDIRRNPDDSEFDITLKKAAIIGQSTLLALENTATCRLFRNGRINFDNVRLAGSAGRVTVSGLFDPGGSSDLQIAVSDFNSDGWLELIFTDRFRFQGLNAQVRVVGQAGAPVYTVQGTLDNLGSPDVPMAFSGRFNLEYGNKVFKIQEFAWEGQKGQKVHLTGTLPLDPLQADLFIPGPIVLSGRARIDDVGVLGFITPWLESTGGSIQCDLDLSGTWKLPTGNLHLAVKDLKRPDEIRPLPSGPYTVTGDVRIDGDLLALEMLEAHSSDWQMRASGQWTGVPTLKDMVRPDTRRLTGQVNLEGSLAVADLSLLAREFDGVRRLAGRLEATGNLQGPITAPSADAIIKLTNGEFTPNFDMPPLRDLNLEAAVTPQMVTLQTLTGEMGGAPFELAGSWQLAAGSEYAADLRLHGQNLLLYRNESLRLRADTDLTLKGPLARLLLAGEVAITDGRFSKNFGVIEGITAAGAPDTGGGFRLFSIIDPPLRDMVFDVRITARKPFEVRNNLVRGSIRPDLQLTGTGEIPLLVGKVYVESTRLYLPAGRIQVETGLVRFEKTDPDRPRLDLIGTSTMLGYDITAVIDGPYDEPVITLSSVPPLPDEELLMLLLTGQPPKSSGSQASGMKQGLNVAVFLGRDLISRLFGGDADEATDSILDRFDVEVGRAITQKGEDTIHSQFRLADDVLVEGDGLYLTGERDYFDYYNGGIKFVFRFR